MAMKRSAAPLKSEACGSLAVRGSCAKSPRFDAGARKLPRQPVQTQPTPGSTSPRCLPTRPRQRCHCQVTGGAPRACQAASAPLGVGGRMEADDGLASALCVAAGLAVATPAASQWLPKEMTLPASGDATCGMRGVLSVDKRGDQGSSHQNKLHSQLCARRCAGVFRPSKHETMLAVKTRQAMCSRSTRSRGRA